jgi:hypothetical protein
VDTARVLANGTVKPYFRDRILSPIIWDYPDPDAFKGDLAMMDLISTNEWKRPIYISTTVPSDQYKGLEKFFVQEGLAYRIVPIRIDTPEKGEFGMVDPFVMYDNLMDKFTWGNAGDPKVYLDENNRRMFSNFKRIFASLGSALITRGDTARTVEVAKRGLGIVTPPRLPDDFFSIGLAELLVRSGRKEEGVKLLGNILDYSRNYLEYAVGVRPEDRFGLDYPMGINMQAMLDIYNFSLKFKLDSLATAIEPQLNDYYSKLYSVK